MEGNEAVKEKYITRYPHLAQLKHDNRAFWINATRLEVPETVNPLELYKAITESGI